MDWSSRGPRGEKRLETCLVGGSHSRTSGTDDPSPESISTNDSEVEKHPLMVAEVREKLETDYQLYKLPTDDSLSTWTSSGALSSLSLSVSVSDNSTQLLVDRALEPNSGWKEAVKVKDVKNNVSGRCGLKWWPGETLHWIYDIVCLLNFLDPLSINLPTEEFHSMHKNWQRQRKLDSLNQLFLTLTLRLNLQLSKYEQPFHTAFDKFTQRLLSYWKWPFPSDSKWPSATIVYME